MTHVYWPCHATRVFVNNAPDEWHVVTGQWGQSALAVCASQEVAEWIVEAVNRQQGVTR